MLYEADRYELNVLKSGAHDVQVASFCTIGTKGTFFRYNRHFHKTGQKFATGKMGNMPSCQGRQEPNWSQGQALFSGPFLPKSINLNAFNMDLYTI